MTQKNKHASFINMMMADSIWTPHAYQMVFWHNPSRLNALWLGLVAPLVMLPHRLLVEVVLCFLAGHFNHAARNMMFVPLSTCMWAWAGLRGELFAVNLPYAVLSQSRFLTPAECLQALASGQDDVVINNGWVPVPSHTAGGHDRQGSESV